MKRVLIVVILPLAIIFTFVSTFWREVGRAFRYAWLDVRIEIDAAAKMWRKEL